MSSKFFSYLRVSTDRQGSDGLGIEAQRAAISRYLSLCGGELIGEYVEVESGKRGDRPILEAALLACRRNKATLLVAKLDRLARTVSFLSRLIDTRVDFIAVDNPHANKLMVHVLSAFAEHERDMIAGRTRAALAAAKARGTILGSPRLAEARRLAAQAVRERADRACANVLPIIEDIRSSGVRDLRGIADALTARGVATRRGGRWHATTVRNALRRSVIVR